MSLLTASVFATDAALAQSNAIAVKASAGAIVGRLTNAAKLPIAGATITAVRADGGAIRATISGSDGVYSFADLPPGVWSLTVQAEGAPDVTAPSLQVTASQATRRDITVGGAVVAAAPIPLPAPAPGATAPAAVAPPATVTVRIPEALQEPDPAPAHDKITPWAAIGYV